VWQVVPGFRPGFQLAVPRKTVLQAVGLLLIEDFFNYVKFCFTNLLSVHFWQEILTIGGESNG
jgi:hypothetical protein